MWQYCYPILYVFEWSCIMARPLQFPFPRPSLSNFKDQQGNFEAFPVVDAFLEKENYIYIVKFRKPSKHYSHIYKAN